jgi:hypothetical protein
MTPEAGMIGVGLSHYLTLAAILFTIGIFGIFLNPHVAQTQNEHGLGIAIKQSPLGLLISLSCLYDNLILHDPIDFPFPY